MFFVAAEIRDTRDEPAKPSDAASLPLLRQLRLTDRANAAANDLGIAPPVPPFEALEDSLRVGIEPRMNCCAHV